MKKYVLLLSVISTLIACGGGNSTQNTSTIQDQPKTEAFTPDKSNPDYVAGIALVKKSDCLSCHHETKKLIGPSYKDIAAKFSNDAATHTLLAEKIIKGSKGEWGDVEMTPHPTLSKSDAEQMAKYIMTLKTN